MKTLKFFTNFLIFESSYQKATFGSLPNQDSNFNCFTPP